MAAAGKGVVGMMLGGDAGGSFKRRKPDAAPAELGAPAGGLGADRGDGAAELRCRVEIEPLPPPLEERRPYAVSTTPNTTTYIQVLPAPNTQRSPKSSPKSPPRSRPKSPPKSSPLNSPDPTSRDLTSRVTSTDPPPDNLHNVVVSSLHCPASSLRDLLITDLPSLLPSTPTLPGSDLVSLSTIHPPPPGSSNQPTYAHIVRPLSLFKSATGRPIQQLFEAIVSLTVKKVHNKRAVRSDSAVMDLATVDLQQLQQLPPEFLAKVEANRKRVGAPAKSMPVNGKLVLTGTTLGQCKMSLHLHVPQSAGAAAPGEATASSQEGGEDGNKKQGFLTSMRRRSSAKRGSEVGLGATKRGSFFRRTVVGSLGGRKREEEVVLDFWGGLAENAHERFARYEEVDSFEFKRFINVGVLLAPPASNIENALLDRCETWENQDAENGISWNRLQTHPHTAQQSTNSLFSRPAAGPGQDAFAKVVGVVDASKDTVFAWLWSFCSNCRNEAHLLENGDLLRREFPVSGTRSKLCVRMMHFPVGFDDRIFYTFFTWKIEDNGNVLIAFDEIETFEDKDSKPGQKKDGGAYKSAKKLARLAMNAETSINETERYNNHDAFLKKNVLNPPRQSEVEVIKNEIKNDPAAATAVRAYAKGFWRVKALAPNVSEVMFLQSGNLGGSLPFFVEHFQAEQTLATLAHLQDQYTRPSADVDREVRLAFPRPPEYSKLISSEKVFVDLVQAMEMKTPLTKVAGMNTNRRLSKATEKGVRVHGKVSSKWVKSKTSSPFLTTW
ncbi:hypothetical protein TeGR_g9712 [Tetraparma gracilis]|uniref:Uncharacterized protein n=1 Tax=Tetraparma gracilis TaxID=2962635 RepID=A0ABQ6NC67_9STRA|nr:hypothetical protein TeGR_g9712 [Tetraparma gracilis]